VRDRLGLLADLIQIGQGVGLVFGGVGVVVGVVLALPLGIVIGLALMLFGLGVALTYVVLSWGARRHPRAQAAPVDLLAMPAGTTIAAGGGGGGGPGGGRGGDAIIGDARPQGWRALAADLERQRDLVRSHYQELDEIIGPHPGSDKATRAHPIEVLFELEEPTYSSISPLEAGNPHHYRLGLRNRTTTSLKRVRVSLTGYAFAIDGIWHGLPPQVDLSTRRVFLREMHDRPPFEKSREGMVLDPSTKPTLFLITSRHLNSDRFDVLHTMANENMPLNPERPVRVLLEVLAENLEPIPVTITLWTEKLWPSSQPHLLCKAATG
jgi:hypothetical protein